MRGKLVVRHDPMQRSATLIVPVEGYPQWTAEVALNAAEVFPGAPRRLTFTVGRSSAPNVVEAFDVAAALMQRDESLGWWVEESTGYVRGKFKQKLRNVHGKTPRLLAQHEYLFNWLREQFELAPGEYEVKDVREVGARPALHKARGARANPARAATFTYDPAGYAWSLEGEGEGAYTASDESGYARFSVGIGRTLDGRLPIGLEVYLHEPRGERLTWVAWLNGASVPGTGEIEWTRAELRGKGRGERRSLERALEEYGSLIDWLVEQWGRRPAEGTYTAPGLPRIVSERAVRGEWETKPVRRRKTR